MVCSNFVEASNRGESRKTKAKIVSLVAFLVGEQSVREGDGRWSGRSVFPAAKAAQVKRKGGRR